MYLFILTDPRSNKIFYAGKSVDPDALLHKYTTKAIYRDDPFKTTRMNTRFNHQLRDILNSGRKPRLDVVFEVSELEADTRLETVCADLLRDNQPLTNFKFSNTYKKRKKIAALNKHKNPTGDNLTGNFNPDEYQGDPIYV